MTRPLCVLLCSITLSWQIASAEPIPTRSRLGPEHGFLVVKTPEGRVIGEGDLVQTIDGINVRSRLIFRFRDGSIDDESTEFTQRETLRLISDHHVQKGPSFPKGIDLTIHMQEGTVGWRQNDSDKAEGKTAHMDLPDDLANGMMPAVLENMNGHEARVSYLALDGKPRLVRLVIRPSVRDHFSVAGIPYSAVPYNVHIELGGLAGMVAPFIGKQPEDLRTWVIPGDVPTFAKMEGSLYLGGPTWVLELASPVWPKPE